MDEILLGRLALRSGKTTHVELDGRYLSPSFTRQTCVSQKEVLVES